MQPDYTAPPAGRILPDAAREYMIAQYGHSCFRCGLQPCDERPTMDVDHIIPVARGGGNYFGNYQFLCGPCNSWKGTKIIDFRPGDPSLIDAGLEIIPNEERVRKSPLKIVPIAVPAPEIIIKRVEVPVLPAGHDCYDALRRLFSEYTSSMNRVAELTGTVERERAKGQEYFHKWVDHQCACPPFAVFLVPVLLFLVSTTLAIYFYIN